MEPIDPNIRTATQLQTNIDAALTWHVPCDNCSVCQTVQAMKVAVNRIYASIGLDALYSDIGNTALCYLSIPSAPLAWRKREELDNGESVCELCGATHLHQPDEIFNALTARLPEEVQANIYGDAQREQYTTLCRQCEHIMDIEFRPHEVIQ